MKTEFVNISQVQINTANPRTITDSDFDKLVNSILMLPKMLELRPIIVDDLFVALGGNMRTKALEFLAGCQEAEILEKLRGLRGYAKKSKAEQKDLETYWKEWIINPQIPIVKASNLSDEEKQEFIIKDNGSFGKWDFDALANMFDSQDLIDWGCPAWNADDSPLDMDSFFDSEEPGGKETDLTIKIIIPEEQKEHEQEIRDLLEDIKGKYAGLKIV